MFGQVSIAGAKAWRASGRNEGLSGHTKTRCSTMLNGSSWPTAVYCSAPWLWSATDCSGRAAYGSDRPLAALEPCKANDRFPALHSDTARPEVGPQVGKLCAYLCSTVESVVVMAAGRKVGRVPTRLVSVTTVNYTPR